MRMLAAIVLTVLIGVTGCGSNHGEESADPLSAWNDTAAKTSITSFVDRVTTQDDSDFVEEEDRIAVFDNDGTLWAEAPIPFQLAFALDEVKRRAAADGGADGVLATMGGMFGGWALFVLDGQPHFAYRVSNQPRHLYRIAAAAALTPGNHTVRVDFRYDGGGIGKGATVRMLVDEKPAAEGRVEQSVVARFSLDETFDVGAETGTAVVDDYADKMPFEYGGNLKRLLVLLEPEELDEKDKQRLLEQLAHASVAVH